MITSKELRSFCLPNGLPLFTVRPDSFDKNRQNVDSGNLFLGDEMTCGIYMIENVVTGDIYIGQSINLAARKRQHLSDLNNNRHRNAHLQSAHAKYGKGNFMFKIFIYCEHFELSRYEQDLVNRLNPKYNIRREYITSNLGIKLSNITKSKMSMARMGHIISDETKRKISEANKGRIKSEENRRKISKVQSGRHLSLEHRRNISKGLMGHVISEAQRQKYSKTRMGHLVSEQTRRKISESHKGKCYMSENNKKKLLEANKGHPRSDETKRKISETLKRNKQIKELVNEKISCARTEAGL